MHSAGGRNDRGGQSRPSTSTGSACDEHAAEEEEQRHDTSYRADHQLLHVFIAVRVEEHALLYAYL